MTSLRDKPILTTPQLKHIDWRGVPLDYVGRCSAVCRSLKDCHDLVAWFEDPEFCPFQPVFLIIPDPSELRGVQFKSIVGDGYAPAAELRDVAVAIWERTVNGESRFDMDVAREKAGLVPREVAEDRIREALWDRAQRHKSSPVTDPMRQPQYPNPTNKVQFPQHPGVPYAD